MHSIKPEINDLVEWGDTRFDTARKTNKVRAVLPDGVTVLYIGDLRFIPNGKFRVIGIWHTGIFRDYLKPIPPERLEAGLMEDVE